VQLYQQAASSGNPGATPPPETPSVEIDVDVDNHQIEASICKSWLVSAAGRLAKQENPNGYKNVLLHMKAHMIEVNKQMAAAQLHQDQITLATGAKTEKVDKQTSGSVPAEKPKQSEKVSGASNAKTPIS